MNKRLILAIFLLLPLNFSMGVALLAMLFYEEGLDARIWTNAHLWFFILGIALFYMMIRLRSLRSIVYLIYVFGHEATHALAAWICLAKVSDFTVTSKGGHVMVSKSNAFISLSPYFLPFYVIVCLLVLGFGHVFFSINLNHFYIPAVLGFWGAFHIYWLIKCGPMEQPDLFKTGIFYSVLYIIACNIFLLVISLACFSLISLTQYVSIVAQILINLYGFFI